MRTTISVLIVALLAAVCPARATTFVGVNEHTLTRSADAIVIGTVRALESVAKPDGEIDTLVTLEVERAIKGHVGPRITLKQLGGRVNGRLLWIAGSPRFAVGDHQLVFLSHQRGGSARTTALGMGQFTLSAHPRTGEMMANRHVDGVMLGNPPVRRLRLARLLQTIGRAMAADTGTPQPLASEPAEAADSTLQHEVLEKFTLLQNPPARWFEPDQGQAVLYGVDPAGDDNLGSSTSNTAIDGAMAAWTNVSGASIVLQRGGPVAPAPLVCDGVSQIVFNDPFDEMDNPVNCSGVLALGGYCSSSDSET
ncbi:MAG TPA: hypothetical protein VLV15_08010, partial [Dongiaceae bacterium]|nr:hypothetical protein [Dongiaceae bacterium]